MKYRLPVLAQQFKPVLAIYLRMRVPHKLITIITLMVLCAQLPHLSVGQYVPRQQLALGIYPLHLELEGRNPFYMASLAYDYRLKNSERGFTIGAFTTYVRRGVPTITESVIGPRVGYCYQQNRTTVLLGSGLGYGWRTGPPGAESSNLRVKYNVAFSYRLLGTTGLHLEISNYRNHTPTRFGFWPMIGINTQF
ncbi:hypothetical protein F5984_07795 [Rudanella paleaurantiibacter]|uniref:Uncharacterized protein n=1 Tax=Rudanella paleaurantiibacter TaxID=2614655 RepID=A0A7J5U4W5_9BACT|nr:hypothetical protein [Rudanella paleaurantiibacter]KAB7732105.1 hypothetical protein F5984_07795 [Rudanella paleaurantiibacter]